MLLGASPLGASPLGASPRHSPGWGGRQGQELFKYERSQSRRPGARFLWGLAGLPGMCVLFLQEIPSESPAGVSRATGGPAPPARIVPAPLCWPRRGHRCGHRCGHRRGHRHGGLCRDGVWGLTGAAAPCPCPRGAIPGDPVTVTRAR